MTPIRYVLSLCLVIAGQVPVDSGLAADPPSCGEPIDPATFVPKGTKIVIGASGERLYLHSHPTDTSAYIAGGDRVVVGDTCGDRTAVKYQGKRREFYGWVESKRLADPTNGGTMEDAVVAVLQGDWYGESRSAQGFKFAIRGHKIKFVGCKWMPFTISPSSPKPTYPYSASNDEFSRNIAVEIHGPASGRCSAFPVMTFLLFKNRSSTNPEELLPCSSGGAWISTFQSGDKTLPEDALASGSFACK